MNFNILSYIIFFSVVAYVTIVVGRVFFKNGEHFILNLIPEDPHLAHSINKLLITGYYLLNLGYAAAIIKTWNRVDTVEQLISTTCSKIGFIILGLGIMHFKNLFYLHLYKRYRDKIFKNKVTSKT